MKTKEITHEVIENRGYGIEYSVFEGSFEDCQNWMKDNTDNGYPLPEYEWAYNGDGYPWTYAVSELQDEVQIPQVRNSNRAPRRKRVPRRERF